MFSTLFLHGVLRQDGTVLVKAHYMYSVLYFYLETLG